MRSIVPRETVPFPVARKKSVNVAVGLPLTATTTSPAFTPATAAAVSASAMISPAVPSGTPYWLEVSGVTGVTSTPFHPPSAAGKTAGPATGAAPATRVRPAGVAAAPMAVAADAPPSTWQLVHKPRLSCGGRELI
jgi:hypothetical protein